MIVSQNIQRTKHYDNGMARLLTGMIGDTEININMNVSSHISSKHLPI